MPTEELDPPPIEPDDYKICPYGPLGYHYFVQQGQRILYNGPEWDAAIAEILANMSHQQYWPNVWYINGHGNVDLLTLDEETKTSSIAQSWV